MATYYSPKVVTDGLVLCLDAGNPKSYNGTGTSSYDLSGANNDGTLTNGPAFTGSFGGAIVFDGSNDYISVPSTNGPIQFGTNPFAIELWIYPTNSTARQGLLTSSGGVNGTGPIFAIQGQGTTNAVGSGLYGSADTVNTGNNGITSNVWNHVVLTRTSTSTNATFIFVNGILKAAGTISTNFSSAQAVGIGYTNVAGEYYVGNIASVRVYKNKSLSLNEILQNYNATKARFGL
jgi:hypothetical protein